MNTSARTLLLIAVVIGSFFCASHPAFAQSQSLNGQIEGTVQDQNNAAVLNAIVTATNIETGSVRTVEADSSGVYRFPILTLGLYRIEAKAAGFKDFVRNGVELATGQTVTVDIKFLPGDIRENVTVSSDPTSVDAGKTDLGRVMTAQEVGNLPLVSRNPYNFALLQTNVTGRASGSFAFPSVNANGYTRRVNFQLDGSNNTQADRAGVRLMVISETFVREVQLVANGFAPEFGNTPGLIMNVVTPSGTNKISGSASYRFMRTPFFARPFFYSSSHDLPENNGDIFTAAIGGPILKDRWHFYFGHEWADQDDKLTRRTTIDPGDRDQLIAAGLSPDIFVPVIPSSGKVQFYIFRTDLQLDSNNRLSARFNLSDGHTVNFGPVGGETTLERGVDTKVFGYSAGAQLVSYRQGILNELRFQYAHRVSKWLRNESSGSGPTVVIKNGSNNIAEFGPPDNAGTISPLEKSTQIQNNFTWSRGRHALKIGGGFNFIDDFQRSALFSRYTFGSIAEYAAARSGEAPRGYVLYEGTVGDPDISYSSVFWNTFAQDEWKLTRRLKLTFGLRYDLYQVPEADPAAPFPASREFNVDANNFAPRFGFVYALREGRYPTVLRGGAGLYFDTPWLNMYQRSLLNNGNPRFRTLLSIRGEGPYFPSTTPSGTARIEVHTVAPDLSTMQAAHFHLQAEQALTRDIILTAGIVHSAGRHIAVYRSVNAINPVRCLADGRPVYSSLTDARYRIDPRFNFIQMAESAGNSRYDAFSMQLKRRLSDGILLTANYTLSKAVDDAPEQNVATGGAQIVLSDPTDRSRDRGYSLSDQRHTFSMSLVANPRFEVRDRLLNRILNNNQIGLIALANSGARFNIVAGTDLNFDGSRISDRPVGIKRNSGKTPPQFNIDLRYSRFVRLTERFRIEAFADFINVFNINSITGYTDLSVPIDDQTGELTGPLPDFKARDRSTAQESRQLQLGIKFYF